MKTASCHALIRIYTILVNNRFEYLRVDLENWFSIATGYIYAETAERAALRAFHHQVQWLIEAVQVINQHEHPLFRADEPPLHEWPEELKEKMLACKYPVLLSREQAQNPLTVIGDFFDQFSISQCKHHLWNWLIAGISHQGEYPADMNATMVLYTYEAALGLIEPAYTLYQRNKRIRQLYMHYPMDEKASHQS